MALDAEAAGLEVTFVVSAEAGDEEMAERIQQHQAERPQSWRIVEAPRQLLDAIRIVRSTEFLVIDCLSFWVANLVMDDISTVEVQAFEIAEALRSRTGATVVVSNEVGMGLVPDYELGRRFRDTLGRVNATIAQHADDAFLVVAGRTLRLES